MQWSHFAHDPQSMIFFSSESQIYFWLHKHMLWHSFFCYFLFFCIECFVKKKFIFVLGFQQFFLLVSLFACFKIARNLFTIFFTHSSSECVLCLLYDLSCDEPASFYNYFLLRFLFSELSVTSALFLSKVKPCCNLLKCCSHSAIAIFVFLCICVNWEINCVNRYHKLLFIGLSLCLIMSSNCSTFYIGNFCVVHNPFAIAFLYTNI